MGDIIALLWIIATPILALALWLLNRKFKKKIQKQKDISTAREKELAALRERFAAVFNADDEAKKILSDALERGNKIIVEAEKRLAELQAQQSNAQSSAENRLAELQEQQDNAQAAIDALLKNARQEAASLLKAAQKEADELTGAIGRKVQDAIDYEKAIKALRNKLNGYGDEYLVPPQMLLDELADDFGHTEAGQALKHAREHTRDLVKAGAAATCDYAEEYRKKTAIAFVLDAFNGKVDSIQARMRHDNVGKLQQEAKDAFALVNANGKAFRDARIEPGYLVARLEEIKWGAVVLELRERAREEQRALKEQMREEERARREYEKALREAVKKEENAKIALDKSKLAYEKAVTERERQQLAKRIKEFEERLAQAKADEEKAISMAQLTRSGHVYILSNVGSFGETVFKIGMTRRLDPMDRVKELGDASVPFPFDVHALIYTEDAPELESKLHKAFNMQRMNKVNYRKEFFRVEVEKIRDAVKAAGAQAQFTLLAQALEYKESRAIEQLPPEEQAKILAKAVKSPQEQLRHRILGNVDDDVDA